MKRTNKPVSELFKELKEYRDEHLRRITESGYETARQCEEAEWRRSRIEELKQQLKDLGYDA